MEHSLRAVGSEKLRHEAQFDQGLDANAEKIIKGIVDIGKAVIRLSVALHISRHIVIQNTMITVPDNDEMVRMGRLLPRTFNRTERILHQEFPWHEAIELDNQHVELIRRVQSPHILPSHDSKGYSAIVKKKKKRGPQTG